MCVKIAAICAVAKRMDLIIFFGFFGVDRKNIVSLLNGCHRHTSFFAMRAVGNIVSGKFISVHRRGGYDPPAFFVRLSPQSLRDST